MSGEQKCSGPVLIFALSLGAAGALTATAALAASATVNLTTYLRAGAGEQFAALDEIDPGIPFDVRSCADGWCRIVSGGATGYIQQSAMSAPDIHKKPTDAAALTACFTAKLNGAPHSGDEVRVCGK